MGSQSNVTFEVALLQRRIDSMLLCGARVRRTVDYTGTANSGVKFAFSTPDGWMVPINTTGQPILALAFWTGTNINAQSFYLWVRHFEDRSLNHFAASGLNSSSAQTYMTTNTWYTRLFSPPMICLDPWPDTLPGTATTI